MGASADQPCIIDLDEGKECFTSTPGFYKDFTYWLAEASAIGQSRIFQRSVLSRSAQVTPGETPAGATGDMECAGILDVVKEDQNKTFASINVVSAIFSGRR